MTFLRKSGLYVLAVAVALGVAASASSSVKGVGTPALLRPSSGVNVQSLPVFAWTRVGGADHYEFAIAADAGFNSPVLGSQGDFTTRSTQATLVQSVPNGTYYWHVRAVSKDGSVGSWSGARRFRENWDLRPRLTSPRGGATVAYPRPLILQWAPVPGAAKYDVTLATDDNLGSLVTNSVLETSGTSFAPAVALHEGKYWWAVTPVDAEGNKGERSKIRSFQWTWPTKVPGGTLPAPEDLITSAQVKNPDPNYPTLWGSTAPFDSALYLPRFHWASVPGAISYELEINSDEAWAAGSRVCCDNKILRNEFTPLATFKSNKYYWRVRAFDAQGNAGAWTPSGNGTNADSFVKTFDNVCIGDLTTNCVNGGSDPSTASIRNLRVENWNGDNVTGGTTGSPIVRWDPVPGAAMYEFEVTRFVNGRCDYSYTGSDHWSGRTATAAWTPLGAGFSSRLPYPSPVGVASDGSNIVAGASYCIRVRARADDDTTGSPVYGDFSYLPSITQPQSRPAFTFSGGDPAVTAPLATPQYSVTPVYHAAAANQGKKSQVPCADANPGVPCVTQMPVLRWAPIQGAQAYWVIVAKDRSFTNIVDYAFTTIPAYAPRGGGGPTTYPDETTNYYWVVLPAALPDGTHLLGTGDPLSQIPGTFMKEIPPSDLRVDGQPRPVFQWDPVPGARRYDFQISTDPNFGSTIESATTASTSYTAAVTYPGKTLYWRVRADDANLVGLSWATDRFTYSLPRPKPAGNQSTASGVPTWSWAPVPGAMSYDVHIDGPGGVRQDLHGVGAAITPTGLSGTGVFHWQVRANFPNSAGTANGPYSHAVTFAHTVNAPRGGRSSGGPGSLLLVWNGVPGAAKYQIQIATKPDFSSTVESVTTDEPTYAPRFLSGYDNGGTFFWRVAAQDGNGAVGDFSETAIFRLPAHK